jgi:hypothetical protein
MSCETLSLVYSKDVASGEHGEKYYAHGWIHILYQIYLLIYIEANLKMHR